jgi:mannose-6-phosphate isomerase-like protein (cupin superfamily)
MVRVHRDDPASWRIAFRRKRAPKTVQDFDQVPERAERARLGSVGFVSGFVQAHTSSLPSGRLQSAVVEVFGLQESPGFRHSGEEFVYCLSGVLQLVVGDERRTLYPGDSAVFDSKFRHRYESAPENPDPSAKLLMVWYEAEEEGFSIQRDEECEVEYGER